jgi:PAS domain S-box-containing protein
MTSDRPPSAPVATATAMPGRFADRCAAWLQGHEKPLWWRLAAGGAFAGGAALLHLAFFGTENAFSIYGTFTSAVILGSIYGGWCTGATAAVLAVPLALLWLRPGPLAPQESFGLVFFLLDAPLIIALAGLLHRSQRRLATETAGHRSTEEQLARATRDWQSTFDAARDATWIVDRDLRIQRSNRAAELLFATAGGEMRGRFCWEIAFRSATPPADCPLTRSASSLKRETTEVRLDTRWFEVSVDPILDEAGRFSGAVQTVADITARRLAEEERALLGNTIGGSLNEIYIFDAATLQFRYVNDGALRNLGYTPDQIHKLTPLDLVSGFDAATFAALLEPMRRGEMPTIVIETLNRRADGSTYPVESHIQLLVHDGRPVFLAIVSDITTRRQLENQLRAAHADLERQVHERTAALAASNALLDETGRIARVGGWEYDLRTGVVGWTLAVRQIHEVPPDYTPTVDSLTSFYEPDVLPRITAALSRLRADGTGFDLELPFVTATHIPLWVRTTGQAYREDGAIVKIGGVVQDITARRRAEDELRQQRGQLEQLLAERTAANARLRELDRLKSEFLSTMSHELRTPLNSIIGFTSILLKGLAGPLNPEQLKQLGLVQSSARHLLSLINDLLDLSRIESGRLELQRDAFDFADIVSETVNLLHPMAEQKGIALRHECTPASLPLFGDRRRTLQILLNLATNAVKFTERGAVDIVARIADARLVVAVRDTGIGIRPDQLPNLFEAFRQLDASARRHYEGTGLGLHLSKKLIEMLGGTISVESASGAGSTFTISLPITPP